MLKISLFYFIISLFFGVLSVYLSQPKSKIIIKYPSIDNLEKIVYQDDNGICYKYQKELTKC